MDVDSIVLIYLYALAKPTTDNSVRLNDTYCLVGSREINGSNSAYTCDGGSIGNMRIRSLQRLVLMRI